MKKRRPVVLVLTWALCSALAPAAAGRDRPEQLDDLRLRDVMWQALPEPVRQVFVGPDGRTWYQLRRPRGMTALQERQIITKQFRRPDPLIVGARIVLFEPGGRVWFRDGRDAIIGFDGRTWLERRPPKDHYFAGAAPNHGRGRTRACNAFAKGRAFFVDSHGVHGYDGKAWSYQAFYQGRGRFESYPTLLPEPDGEGVIAVIRGRQSAVWRWRDDAWKQIDIPSGAREHSLIAAAPRAGKVWLFLRAGAVLWPYGPDDAVKAARTTLKETLAATMSVGPYRATSPTLLYYSPGGTLFIGAKDVSRGGRNLGPGVVIEDARGAARFLAGELAAKGWGGRHPERSGPVGVGTAHGLWLPGRYGQPGPRLLDLRKLAFVDKLPDRRFQWLHAARPDGTLFVGRGEPGGAVMVYRPGAPDDRRLLKVRHVLLRGKGEGAFGVSGDGSVWAETAEHGIARFDGAAWRPVDPLKGQRDLSLVLPGAGGRAVLAFSGGAALITPDGVHRARHVHELIEQHPKAVAAAFSGAGAHCRKAAIGRNGGLAADPDGNIWHFDGSWLSVFAGGRWLSLRKELRRARLGEMSIDYICPVGDGREVYIADFRLDQGRAFCARVKDGRLVFTPAQRPAARQELFLNVREPNGALWIGSYKLGRSGQFYYSGGARAYRVTGGGKAQEVKGYGWARLCDRSGNVWLGSGDSLRVWRAGKITRPPRVPRMTTGSRMFSDRPGSVFVWTPYGLHHLVALDPNRPADFTHRGQYTPQGLDEHVWRAACSRLGYIVAYTDQRDERGRPRRRLHLIDLPK